ncbi:hypothetical protein, partial [Aquabacterium sp.]|uniref:hypothetical protein n=1 Tax=Aquabacterium sp. TaxID=1872578 RepID=UPI003D008BDB
ELALARSLGLAFKSSGAQAHLLHAVTVSHSGLHAEVLQTILNSNWGRPSHVNRTTTQHGSREQWVYGGGNNLYFENGKLTAVQN